MSQRTHMKFGHDILLILSIMGLILYLILYLLNVYTSITYPYEIEYGEGEMLNQVLLMTRGESIYRDITGYPYIIGNYPPIYPLICVPLAKLLGVSFGVGRFVSVLSAVLLGLLVYRIVKEKTNRQIALISGLLFFASPFIYSWTRLFRVDTLGLLFSLTGIYLVIRYENTKGVYLSTIPFLLAIFTRQTYIAAPVSSFIYLYLKDKGGGIKFIMLFGVLSIIPFLMFNHMTEGQFYLHIIKYNVIHFSLNTAVQSYFDTLQIHLVIFILAFGYIAYSISKKWQSLFVIYFIISALVAITVGKVGSNINYFIELIAVCCILSGFSINKLHLEIQSGRSRISILVGVMLIMQLVIFASAYYLDAPRLLYLRGGMPTSADMNIRQRVSTYIIDADGAVLSEDIGLLVVNDKDVLFNPFSFTQLQREGIWNQSRLVGDIEDRYFSLIILEFDVNSTYVNRERFTEEMIYAMRDHYSLVERIGTYHIYTPKNSEMLL